MKSFNLECLWLKKLPMDSSQSAEAIESKILGQFLQKPQNRENI